MLLFAFLYDQYRMSTIAYLILMMSATWLIGVSLLMLFRPTAALVFLGKFASTDVINYSELSLRMLSGFAFLQYAGLSRYPNVFYVIGCFLATTAGILLFVPRRWHASYATYWSRKLTPLSARFAAPFSFVAGVLLIVALH